VEDKLKPLIKPAKEGAIELFFVDASHFVMGGVRGDAVKPGEVFCEDRLWEEPV
jgi:hypothetical protein